MSKKHLPKIGKRVLAGIMSATLIITGFGMIPAKAELVEETINAESQIFSYCVGGKTDGQWHFTEKSEDNTTAYENVYYFHDSNDDKEYNGAANAERNATLVDGDVENGIDYTGTDVIFIDMGDKEVTKVEIYKAHSTFGYYNFATGDVFGFEDGQVPDSESLTDETPVKFTASAGIRLEDTANLTVKPEYNISRKENLVYDDNKVSITGIDFGRFLILDADNSVWTYISEIKVYTGEMEALEAVNWAGSGKRLQTVLEEKAEALGLDLSGYNTLSDHDKGEIVRRVFEKKPEGGYTLDSLKTTFAYETEIYYYLTLGNARVEITDKEIELPLYYVRNESDEHCIGTIQFNMYYDADALEYKKYKVPNNSLGKRLKASVTVSDAPATDDKGTYIRVSIVEDAILPDTELLDGLLMNFYFAPKNAEDNTTYDITAVGDVRLRPLIDGNGHNPDNEAILGRGEFSDGSITFDPKARMKEETIDATRQIVSYAIGGTVNGAAVSRAKSDGNTSVANNIYYLNEIVVGDAGNNTLLVDGDTETTFKYGSSRVVMIDMGDKNVARVEIHNVAGNYCFATGDISGFEGGEVPSSIQKGTPVKFTANAAIRLNKSEGYNISRNENMLYDGNIVAISGIDFGRFLILDANNSSNGIAEIKVYTKEKEENTEYKLGDVNNDDEITLADALMALQISVRSATDAEKLQQPYLSADVDQDGTVDINDVLKILQKANEKEVPDINWFG